MKKGMLLFILCISFAESLKVITLVEEFGKASTANPKGKYVGEKIEGNIGDISLCFRFFAFFQQKTTLGIIHIA